MATEARWAKDLPEAFEDLWQDYERSLRRLKRSPKTVEMNRSGFERLVLFVLDQGVDRVEDIKRDHVHGWVESMVAAKTDEQSMAIYVRTARPFFSWWADEMDEVSPFYKAKLPKEPVRPVPLLSLDDLNAMIADCAVAKGTRGWARLVNLRDEALLRGFFDLGVRRGEMHGMAVTDWNRSTDLVHVRESKTYERTLVVSAATGESWARYVRERNKMVAGHKWMWVGRRMGRMTPSGFNQAIARRSIAALGHRVKPHKIRHTSAHHHLVDGGEEGDLVRKMGWNGRSMVDRYGASAADERSRLAQQRLALGDKLA